MARDIDFSAPLDENDLHYLRQRSWLVDEAELQGFPDVRKQVDAEKAEEEAEEEQDDQSGDSDEEVSYSEASVDELKAELKSRDLPVGGKKEELVARLEADDAAHEAEGDEDEEEEE